MIECTISLSYRLHVKILQENNIESIPVGKLRVYNNLYNYYLHYS